MSLRVLWNVPDFRRKLFITLLVIVIYRLASHIPLPGISLEALADLHEMELAASGLFRFADLVAGGAISRASIVALSIYPFITACGLLDALSSTFPRLGESLRFNREGKAVLRTLLTLLLAAIGAISGDGVILPQMGIGFEGVLPRVTAIITLTAGAMLTTWLAWMIGNDGLGMGGYANGVNMIVLANILAAGPLDLVRLLPVGTVRFALLLLALALLIVPVLMVQGAARRVTVQYAQRVRLLGRTYGGGHSYMPFPIVPGGLDAIEIVYTFIAFGALIVQVVLARFPGIATLVPVLPELPAGTPPSAGTLVPAIPLGELTGALAMLLGVMLLTMFQASMNFEEENYAENLLRAGGHIPNVRSGEPTKRYLARIVRRLSMAGAVFTGIYSILPWLLKWMLGLPQPVYVAWAVWTICRIVTDYAHGFRAEISMHSYREHALIK
jgi:preprotein translocase subunit SecY